MTTNIFIDKKIYKDKNKSNYNPKISEKCYFNSKLILTDNIRR